MRILFVVTVAALLAGCGSVSRIRSAAAALVAPTEVAIPARATAVTDTQVVPLPAGTVIETPTARVVLNTPTELRRETRQDVAQTAVGFAPPSAAEQAQAAGVRYFWLAGLGCLLMAGLLAWRKHFLAAVCAACAGVALPVLANVLSSGVATMVGVALLMFGGGLVAAWHILRFKLRPEHQEW